MHMGAVMRLIIIRIAHAPPHVNLKYFSKTFIFQKPKGCNKTVTIL